MIKLYIIIMFFCFSSIHINGQHKINCKCNKSTYRIERYLIAVDSIYKMLNKNTYKNIIFVGTRGLNAANFMFIVSQNGKNKGIYYDLTQEKKYVIEGKKLDIMKNELLIDSSFLHNIPPVSNIISHDFGYFVSFDYAKVDLLEICDSQLISVRNRPFSKGLTSYLNDFPKRK